MYFLIEYDRETKELIQCTEYEDRKTAWKVRFELEEKLQAEGKIWTEAVLFEADNRADLEHNHSRYFKTFKDVFKRFKEFKKEHKKELDDLSKRASELGLKGFYS